MPATDFAAGDEFASALPRFASPPLSRAVLKGGNEDFQVEEILSFEPAGEGPHMILKVRKDGWNSASAARWLAAAVRCRVGDVGYCGHKDRHAVTVQHFSVPLPAGGALPDAGAWPEGLSLIAASRHDRKLRRGVHRENRFLVRLREVDAGRDEVDVRIAQIARVGFPNYFGAQRFGRDGNNPGRARTRLGSRRFRRSTNARESLELSSLRSFLFNRILARRVLDGSWLVPHADDLIVLSGTRSYFPAADEREDALARRLADGDVHVSGPLWGIPGRAVPPALVLRERRLLDRWRSDLDLIEAHKLAMERRPLRVFARDLRWHFAAPGVIDIAFVLPRGSYATMFLAELFDLVDASRSGAGEPA